MLTFWIDETPGFMFHRTDSTNAQATALLRAGVRPPLLVLALGQSAGRGRLGRKWASPAGAGVYLTALVRAPDTDPQLVALAAGLAALRTAKSLAPEAPLLLRWPNDLVTSDNRKLCGILCELVPPGAAAVGVGFNLDDGPLTDVPAVGLRRWTKAPLQTVAPALARSLLEALAALAGPNGPAACVRAAAEIVRGQKVLVRVESGEVSGSVEGLAADGALLVTDDEGRRHRFVAADVRLLRLTRDPRAEGGAGCT